MPRSMSDGSDLIFPPPVCPFDSNVVNTDIDGHYCPKCRRSWHLDGGLMAP